MLEFLSLKREAVYCVPVSETRSSQEIRYTAQSSSPLGTAITLYLLTTIAVSFGTYPALCRKKNLIRKIKTKTGFYKEFGILWPVTISWFKLNQENYYFPHKVQSSSSMMLGSLPRWCSGISVPLGLEQCAWNLWNSVSSFDKQWLQLWKD